jgi:cytochrome c5
MRAFLKTSWCWVLLVAMGLTPVLASAVEKNDAKAIFEARCSLCHGFDKALGKTKTAAEWKVTVDRMKQRAAGRISDADAEIIIKYLSEIRGK